MNYIAIVSLLKPITDDVALAESKLKIHQIIPARDTTTAGGCLNLIVQNDLKLRYGDAYAGIVREDELPGTFNSGDVIAVRTNGSSIMKVVMISSRLDRGWISNSETLVLENLGYYTFCDVEIPSVQEEISSLKKYISELELENVQLLEQSDACNDHVKSLSCRVSMLEYENKQLSDVVSETEEMLTESRKVSHHRSDECKRLLSEMEKMRRSADDDLTSMQDLHMEISDLKKKLFEQYREMANLREDAKYAVRTGSTPVRVSNNDSPIYTEAVNLIKNFDIKTLLSREERDLKLSKNKKLHQSPKKQTKGKHSVPPPWFTLKDVEHNKC